MYVGGKVQCYLYLYICHWNRNDVILIIFSSFVVLETFWWNHRWLHWKFSKWHWIDNFSFGNDQLFIMTNFLFWVVLYVDNDMRQTQESHCLLHQIHRLFYVLSLWYTQLEWCKHQTESTSKLLQLLKCASNGVTAVLYNVLLKTFLQRPAVIQQANN